LIEALVFDTCIPPGLRPPIAGGTDAEFRCEPPLVCIAILGAEGRAVEVLAAVRDKTTDLRPARDVGAAVPAAVPERSWCGGETMANVRKEDLTAEQFASLQEVGKGPLRNPISDENLKRLIELRLVKEGPGGLMQTPHGVYITRSDTDRLAGIPREPRFTRGR
jgi:hypothetical protein